MVCKVTFTVVVLSAVAALYLASVSDETDPGLTAVKVTMLVALLIVSNIGQVSILRSLSFPHTLTVLRVNLTVWSIFFLLLTLAAFTLFRGLAKDLEFTAQNVVLVFGQMFGLLGIPAVIFNTLTGLLYLRYSDRVRRSSGQ